MQVNILHEEVAAEASRSIVQALDADNLLFPCMLTFGIKIKDASGRAVLQRHYLTNSGCHDLAQLKHSTNTAQHTQHSTAQHRDGGLPVGFAIPFAHAGEDTGGGRHV